MENLKTTEHKNIFSLKRIADVQQIFEKITGQKDINIAVPQLIKDYISSKIFQLKVQNAQFEIKWGITYLEFEQESSKWENGSSYEIEQEYYKWGEIITELDHYNHLSKQWI